MSKEEQYTNKPRVEVTEKIMTRGHDMFTLVTKKGSVMIAVADKIVSKKQFETEEAAIEYIDSKPWELLVNVACVCYDLMNKETKK